MPSLTTAIHELVNFDREQQESFRRLMDVLVKVVSSEQFKERVLNYSYTYTTRRWFRTFTHTVKGFDRSNGHSPEKIYEKFMSGATVLQPEADGDIDIYLTLYFSRVNTIGYTYADTVRSWINGKFFVAWLKNKQGRASIIANIVHEYMHKLGYDDSAGAIHTVTYAYGNIAEQVALEYFADDL